MSKQALIVADDPALQPRLCGLLETLGYSPTVIAGAAEAIARLGTERFDLCVVDLDLPAGEGAAAIMKARACQPGIAAIALTAHGSVEAAVEALRAGAADVVAKPFQAAAFAECLHRVAAAGQLCGSRRAPGVAVIGDHPALRLVLDRVAQIAGTEASVLVRGETGTGKEVIARLIHGASARHAGPFVAVNLGAIPASLAEAELFGSLQGALPGADRPRYGRVAAAHGGTLFFDEIAEMPRSVQAKLMQALEAGEVSPVGGGPAVPVDVRVIAATRYDLKAVVAAGRFREDLYYRLDVLPIEIPPLRSRRDDIPALAEHFRMEINAREGRSVPGFALDVMRRLTHYDWPGNVRELANLVERMVVVAGTRMVVMDDLPPHLHEQVMNLERFCRDLSDGGVDLHGLLTEIEERLITKALVRSGGSRRRAAEMLGLNRATLVEKLRRRKVA